MEAGELGEASRVTRRRIEGWGELTEHTDLMLNVFSKLPVYKAAQFRLVCRRWNAALSTPHFASLLYLNSSEAAWFVVNLKDWNPVVDLKDWNPDTNQKDWTLTPGKNVDVLAAYSCSAKTWFQFPISFLGKLGIGHVAVSSGAGLVAFFKWLCPGEQHQIVVFDPRKASLVSLIDMPPNGKIDEVTVGPLALIPSGDPSNNFKLVAYSCGKKNTSLVFNSRGKNSFWVYDSLRKSWTKVKGLGFESINMKLCSLVSGTCAYFLGRCHDQFLRIIVYNSHTNEITIEEGWIPAGFKRRFGLEISPNLFCCRGKLTMCDIKDEGYSSQDEEGTYDHYFDLRHGYCGDPGYFNDRRGYKKKMKQTALVIWEREFEDSAGNWKEVARMPQEMWTEMYSKVEWPVYGMSPRMRICGSLNLVFLQLGWNALVCNLDTGSWEYLPPLPKEIGQKTFRVEDVFVLDLV